MARKTVQDINPGIRGWGVGFANSTGLVYSGAALTAAAASTALDLYQVPAGGMPDHAGVVARLSSAQVFVSGPGTGATSGSWTFTVKKNATIIGTIVIAYNATNLFGIVDLRDVSNNGIPLVAGDQVGLYLAGVPAGALTGLVGVKATITTEEYGIVA